MTLSGLVCIVIVLGLFVLIPLLVDDPLREMCQLHKNLKRLVLIPLLVDDPLRVL